MAELGRHQRTYFDGLTAAQVTAEIVNFETEVRALLFSTNDAGKARREQLEARITYLKQKLGGRTYELFESIGQVHATDCPVAISITCAVAIECKHGYDACPQCDVCNCAVGKVTKG